MATKTKVIGAPDPNSDKPTPIKLTHILMNSGGDGPPQFGGENDKASNYDYLELIAPKCYVIGATLFDVIFAYDEDDGRSEGTIYLGHWNDGVV